MTSVSSRVTQITVDPAFTALRRSFDMYYGDAVRDAAMDAMYARFLRAGDLAFDIGAHVGDRIASFRRLGVRVVALEPQPLCAKAIRAIFAGDNDVMMHETACGAEPGTISLRINSAWEGQVWDSVINVRCTTLDELIRAHGLPVFAKIDVEGFEHTVLSGLSRPLPALSFEFTTIQRDVAVRCLVRLSLLGNYGFDLAIGESQEFSFDRWISARDMAAHIAALPHGANSGDIYCVLQD
jgi:FkbM family methyltransferase